MGEALKGEGESDTFEESYPEKNELDGYSLADTEAVYSVDRMAELLVHGEDMDRDFILSETQQLLGHCADEFQRTLLPVICENCSNWSDEMQFKCAQVWSGILVEAMQAKNLNVPEPTKQSQLVLADRLCKSAMMEERKSAARMYGALSTVCDAHTVQARVLPQILSLFDDSNILVLGTAMESTTKVAAALPVDVVDKAVWPRLMNLADAEDVRIRCTALRSLATILENMRTRSTKPLRANFRESTASLMRREVRFIKQDAKEDLRVVSDEKYMVLEVQSETFGEFLYNIVDILDPLFIKEVYKAYAMMASCNGPLLRRNVAYNFPGFAVCMIGRYGDLTSILTLLSRDKDDEVRWNLSAGIHESLKILVTDSRADYDTIGMAVLLLLTDENPAITANIMERFYEIVSLFQQAKQTVQVRMLVNGLTHLKGMVDGSWRLQDMICKKLQKCMGLFPEKTIADIIMPLMWNLVQQGMPPVRETAARTIIHCIRYIADKNMLNLSIARFYVRLGSRENPYRIRLALIDAALEAIETFSSLFFREFFAEAVFQLVDDPISNVRIKLASVAHFLSALCVNMPQFKAMMNRFRKDPDSDVSQLMKDFPEKVRGVNAKSTSREALRSDRDKLSAERAFYTRFLDEERYGRVEGAKSIGEPIVYDRPPRQTSKTLRGAVSRRTSSFSAVQENEHEEEDEIENAGTFIRRLRSSSRRSSSGDPRAAKETAAAPTTPSDSSFRGSGTTSLTVGSTKSETVPPPVKKGGIRRLFGRSRV